MLDKFNADGTPNRTYLNSHWWKISKNTELRDGDFVVSRKPYKTMKKIGKWWLPVTEYDYYYGYYCNGIVRDDKGNRHSNDFQWFGYN